MRRELRNISSGDDDYLPQLLHTSYNALATQNVSKASQQNGRATNEPDVFLPPSAAAAMQNMSNSEHDGKSRKHSKDETDRQAYALG